MTSRLRCILNPSTELVNKLWRLCSVLRKDGITYPQYVSELTYLLFLKMMQETGGEQQRVPVGLRWRDLKAAEPDKMLETYRAMLVGLADPERDVDPPITRIFLGAKTVLRDWKNLQMLVDAVDKLHWFNPTIDSFGDLYEGLLQKNAEETKRGAGQYFTPRVIIDVLVDLIKPVPGETVQDPATGTGGFLIAAYTATQDGLRPPKITGMENVEETYRLLLMNLYLHGVDDDAVHLGDTLSDDYTKLLRPDVILTNPPFGPAGGRPNRGDLTVTSTVTSYQLPFVEHCINHLNSGGRAAIVIPDNVLFEGGRALELRRLLMATCNLHTILRLPTGIFYAPGVRTNVLFFSKRAGSEASTRNTWVYDMRTNMPAFGKTTPIEPHHFEHFVAVYGHDPNGLSNRTDEGETGRFRCFSRDAIAQRGDNLNIFWLKEDSDNPEDKLSDPDDIALAILGHLRTAVIQIEALSDEFDMPVKDIS